MKAYFFVLRKTNIVTMNSVKESVIKIRIGNNKSYLTAILYCLTAVKNRREKICKRGRKCAVKPNCKRGENDRRRFFFCTIAVAKCSKQQRMGYMHFMVSCNSIR